MMKYGKLTLGQVEALINKIGEKNVLAILQGEKHVIIENILAKLFDKRGRRISEGLQANVCDPDRDFQLYHLQVLAAQYANRILQLHSKMGIDTGITAEQLQQETKRLLAIIQNNPQIANIVNGVYLPVIMPRLKEDDLGVALRQYLEAVGKSYAKVFPYRRFYNHREGTSAGEVSIVSGSRHDQLIAKMKQGPVIGIHFPNPLQGFSIDADREQMATLAKGFILSGLDAVIAMIMYSDVLARDGSTPRLDLAALSWRSADYSLSFEADDDRLDFDNTEDLADADVFCSGGLLFLG